MLIELQCAPNGPFVTLCLERRGIKTVRPNVSTRATLLPSRLRAVPLCRAELISPARVHRNPFTREIIAGIDLRDECGWAGVAFVPGPVEGSQVIEVGVAGLRG